MVKVINPVTCSINGVNRNGFAKIEFKASKLSIVGVIGPKAKGNACCAGQCVDEIRAGKPVGEWTPEMVQQFCDIWERWHLNDMRPYCTHQKELGWDKIANKSITFYNYQLTSEALNKQRAAKTAAIQALKKGETFTPTTEQTKYASLPFTISLPNKISGEAEADYKPSEEDSKQTTKRLGWLTAEEHPDGILCKPCPVCGYKYGTAWLTEEVPQDVIDWLFALPEAAKKPAWFNNI